MLDLQKNNKAAQISAFLKERKYSSDVKRKYFHYFICLIKDKKQVLVLLVSATSRKKMSQLSHDNPNISFSFEI